MEKLKISVSDFYAKDARIKTAISLLSCLSYNNIKSLLNSSYEFQSVLLSKISEINSEIYQLTNMFLESICDNYICILANEIEKNSRVTLPVEKINNIKDIINNVNSAAEQYMKNLELTYELKEGELTLSETQSKLELELLQSENYSKEIFNFIQSKNLLNSILSTLKYDSDEMQQLVKIESTTSATFVSKSRDIIYKYENILNSTLSIFNQAEYLTDSCKIALYIWINICNSSKENLKKFLDKKYSEIRDSVMSFIE
ncbi:MAG: hypothetical protein N2749_00785 [Clostridia bacterium]|nr:hypothetical protein [Clostridia bacterium]